jgi:hypothetical protein
MMRTKGKGDAIHRVVDRMFYTNMGSFAISFIFGLALALLFQRVCKDRECIIYKPPPMKEIEGTVYQVKPGECYTYTPIVRPCVAPA